MATVQALFPALIIITVGNIFSGEGPKDFSRKFEIPDKPLPRSFYRSNAARRGARRVR
jgi:hypothetical protein